LLIKKFVLKLNLFLDDGSCNEIYMDKPPLALIGLPFKEAAWVSAKAEENKQ
jgi:hypothetical protein